MSSSAIDPIRWLKRRHRLALGVIAPLIVAGAIWAFAPLPVPTFPAPLIELAPHNSTNSTQPSDDRALDLAAFAANLWNPPAPPHTPIDTAQEQAVTKTPPRPLNLQLIGIIEESSGERRAAVYDIDHDRLLILAGGDQIREQTVKAVMPDSIELTDGRSTRRLALKQEPL